MFRMENARIVINKDYIKGRIDDRIYGSFVEHMGRVVYGGIYEPGHALADEDGFREDVLDAVREAGITNIRYPGGNFVSCYNWEDGVGEKNKRPKRLELAWKAIETNEFGTDEFMKWCGKAGTAPMLAVNLGTRGIREAASYLEYCNFPEGTAYSDMRRNNGHEEPYHVKTWCLGNEMDGSWQLGHKQAGEYGRLAREAAKAMKIIDPAIEIVSCGSSLNTMETYPQWEAKSLEETYEYVDYISLHQYFDGHDKSTEEFLAQADEMDSYIKTVCSVCDFVKAKKRSDKTLNISFDEWGVWTRNSNETVLECENTPWQQAQPISEMIYSYEDALLFGGMLMALLKNADRVKIACQSLLTNISAMIMTEKGGELWKQTIYYPFAQAAKFAHGIVMDSKVFCHLPYIDSVVVRDGSEVIIFAINRSTLHDIEAVVDFQGFGGIHVIEHQRLICEGKETHGGRMHDKINAVKKDGFNVIGGQLTCCLDRLSWNVIRVGVKEVL